MSGGLAAVYYNTFIKFIIRHFTKVSVFYIFTLLFIGGSYYYYYFYHNSSLIILVNTLQQLSLQGFLYTIGSLIFFCAVFAKTSLSNPIRKFIHLLSVNSLIVYLIHPFWMDIISRLCHVGGIVMTSKKILLIYCLLVTLSVLSSIIITKLGGKLPWLGLLLTGKRTTSTKKHLENSRCFLLHFILSSQTIYKNQILLYNCFYYNYYFIICCVCRVKGLLLLWNVKISHPDLALSLFLQAVLSALVTYGVFHLLQACTEAPLSYLSIYFSCSF